MKDQIHEALKEIDAHMENIDELLPGLPDEIAEDFLMQVQTAASSLEEAHDYLEAARLREMT